MAYINGKQVLFSSKIFGRGGAIVEVAALPTTEIDKGALYRTPFGVYWYDTEWHKIVDEAELEAKGYALESTVNDVSEALSDFTDRVNAILASDDTTLDELQEIVTFIKNNSALIEQVTTNKVNVTDIVDNLSSSATNKPLSAKQGKALKALIDAIVIPTVPTKISAFENDKGYITAVPSQYVTAIKANTDAIAEINKTLDDGIGVASWNDLKDRPFYEGNGALEWEVSVETKDKTSNLCEATFGFASSVLPTIDDLGCYEVDVVFDQFEAGLPSTQERYLLSEFEISSGGERDSYFLLTLKNSICDVKVLILRDYDSFGGQYLGNFNANGIYLGDNVKLTNYDTGSGLESVRVYSRVQKISKYNREIKKLDNKFLDLPNNADFKALEARVENGKQDKLTFDGTYDAATNKAATVKTVTDKIAEVVANAPSDFDTLKEMSDWIDSHEDSVAGMNSSIKANTDAITALDNAVANKLTANGWSTELGKLSTTEWDENEHKLSISSQGIEINRQGTIDRLQFPVVGGGAAVTLATSEDKKELQDQLDEAAEYCLDLNSRLEKVETDKLDTNGWSTANHKLSHNQVGTGQIEIGLDEVYINSDAHNYTAHITWPTKSGQLATVEDVENAGGSIDTSTLYITAGQKAGTTLGDKATAEGNNTTASGQYSHAEGDTTVASGIRCHAECDRTNATARGSHAEGYQTTASGEFSHAEGEGCQATKTASHAEGKSTHATGEHAHAEGNSCYASGSGSHAEGHGTRAHGAYAHVQGKYNDYDYEGKYAHIVGNGGAGSISNAHTLDWSGNAVFAGAVSGTGADYAEHFEWLDGNPNNEDRVGTIVTLEGDKIRAANEGDEILGIVSGTAMVIGDNAEWEWCGKYITDNYGRYITEMCEEFSETINPETGEIEKESLGFFPHRKLNPEWDESQAYTRRSDRSEWDVIGLFGKLYVNDDGSCVVGGYATNGNNGKATASAVKTNMRVMKRITNNIVLVFMK